MLIYQYFDFSTAEDGLAPDVIKKIRQALLDFQPKGRDASGLYHWDRTEMPNGFTSASDADYAEIRDWMVKLDRHLESNHTGAP